MADVEQMVKRFGCGYGAEMTILRSPAPAGDRKPTTMAPPDRMAAVAYERIEEMIVTRELPPGAMISENQLSEELGCGRTPIREALQRLRLEGYVEIHPRRGALVTPIDAARQLELLEVRRPLEHLAAHLAAARATKAERAELLRLADDIVLAAEAGRRADYLQANRAIHDLRAQATHNAILVQTLRPISGISRRFWYAYIEDTDSFAEAAGLHAEASRAMARSDGDAAATAVASLLDLLESLTRRAIDPGFSFGQPVLRAG